MNDPSRVFVSGPFAAFREAFLRSLLKWGYTPDSAANQLHLMAHLSRWLAGEGLDVHTFRENDLQRYFQFRRHAGYTHCVSMKAMLPMLTYLRAEGITFAASNGVSRGPVDFAMDQYRDYLVHERGLAQLTIHNYINAVRPFLVSELSRDGDKINWESLNAARVTAFVVARTPSQSRSLASTTVTALRSFLDYLYTEGLIPATCSCVRANMADQPARACVGNPYRTTSFAVPFDFLGELARRRGWPDAQGSDAEDETAR
jgi:integrase/recombinase XerD